MLAGKKTMTLETLRDQALISLPRGTGLRATIDEAFTASATQPRIAFQASHPKVLAQLAARGLGIVVLPESTVRAHSAELHAITLTRPELRGRLALAWRAEGSVSPAARALISHARKVLPHVSSARPAGLTQLPRR